MNNDTKICLKCYVSSKVIGSRYEDAVIYRKRKCPECGRTWETVEKVYNAGLYSKEDDLYE